MKRVIIFILIGLVILTPVYARDTLNANRFGIYSNLQSVINREIDLKGGMLFLPKGCRLKFNGGIIKNGILIGSNTEIVCDDESVFDNVTIQGDWNIPVISSKWFKNTGEENLLKNVMALTNPEVKNKVVIAEGEYVISVNKEGQSGLHVESNTDLQIDGNIKMMPNSFQSYNIVHAKGENIKITGKGTIIGDKHTHTGTTGEWGMGILISQATNVVVSDLTIKNCWGDCIYVGGNSQNITIENCVLNHGRRQGVSVTSGDNIILRDLSIYNVSGTNPEYAIDIEPNDNGIVGNVLIEDVTVKDCKGGFLVWGGADNAIVNKVTIQNCNIDKTEKMPISIAKCNICEVKKCTVSVGGLTYGIYAKNVQNVLIKRNRLFVNNDWLGRLKSWVSDGIFIDECKIVDVEGNKKIYQ